MPSCRWAAVILKLNPSPIFCRMSVLLCPSLFYLAISQQLKLPTLLKTVWSVSQTFWLVPTGEASGLCCSQISLYVNKPRAAESTNLTLRPPALFSFTVMKIDSFFCVSTHTEALGWHGAQCKLWWCDRTSHVNKIRGRWVRATQPEKIVD